MKVQYEIILLLDWGFQPKEIIGMGFKRKTVYKWSSTYKEALNVAMLKAGKENSEAVRKLKTQWSRLILGKEKLP